MPPYQASSIREIQSVFELPHLKKDALFLDTQCELKGRKFARQISISPDVTYPSLIPDRMPSFLADFISRTVYAGLLKSGATVSDKKDCVTFIDCDQGQEQALGFSFTVRVSTTLILFL